MSSTARTARARIKKRAEIILQSVDSARAAKERVPPIFTYQPVKRVAVIDACNVLHASAGLALNCDASIKAIHRIPDALGLLMVVQQLMSEDFEVKVVICASYMKKNKVENFFVLEQMEQLGILTIAPNWTNDDIRMLQIAAQTGGFVVSNDKYYDHVVGRVLDENALTVVRSRLLPFTFTRTDTTDGFDFLTERKNRLLVTGMKFEINSENKEAMYATDGDETYATAYFERALYSNAKTEDCLECLHLIFEYVQQNFCIMFGVRQPKLPFFHPKFVELPLRFADFKELYTKHTRTEEAWNEICDKNPPTDEPATQSSLVRISY